MVRESIREDMAEDWRQTVEEIIRDDQRKSPLVFLLIFRGLGLTVGKLAGKYWWQLLLGFLLGVLCGHFWW